MVIFPKIILNPSQRKEIKTCIDTYLDVHVPHSLKVFSSSYFWQVTSIQPHHEFCLWCIFHDLLRLFQRDASISSMIFTAILYSQLPYLKNYYVF